jgi:hypothetical protein
MNAHRPLTSRVSLACLLFVSACSSSKTNGGGTGGNGPAPTTCAQSALTILFNPMYSAYDGVHTFQLPAIVSGIDSANTQIAWGVGDPSMVAMQPDPKTGGVMLTMQKAGQTTIYAQAGSLCGAAPLTITAATPDEWMIGSERYNNGVVINLGGAGGSGMATQASCTNCHGDTANGPFKDVAHTPQQTGGFSDDELIDIFEHGTVPKDGAFDSSIVPYTLWQAFHQWDVGDAAKGVVVYLRSLTPAEQKGGFNFGLLADAGIPEAGAGAPTDAAAPDGADAAPDDAGVSDGSDAAPGDAGSPEDGAAVPDGGAPEDASAD